MTLVTVPFIPESPVYLLSRGKSDEAEKSLKWLRGGGDVDVGDELKEARFGAEILIWPKMSQVSRDSRNLYYVLC